MADRVKGITIELNGDTTPLNKALSSTNKEIKNTQTQLKDVEKLLKLDPTNIKLLEQRQRLLAQAVEETKKKLDTLKEAEKQAQEQFAKGEISQQQYDGLQREIAATEQELKKLEDAAQNSNARLAQVSAAAQQFSDAAGKVADKTRGLSLAAGGVVAALGGAALSAVTLSDDLNTLAAQTGFSTDELQMMRYAADRVDVSMETITGAASKLKRNLASTSSEVTAAFSRLGVSVTDANGNMRDSTEVFYEVIEGLSQITNETERDQVAMELFGRSADQLAGIIDDGGKALKDYGKEAKDMGFVLSQQTLNGLNKVNDRIDTLKAQAQSIIALNGAKVVEAFLPLIEDLANGAGTLAEKIAALDEGTLKTIATVAAVIASISPVAGILSNIGGAISGVTQAIGFLSANPIITIGAAALAAGGYLLTLRQNSLDTMESMGGLTEKADALRVGMEKLNSSYNDNVAAAEANYAKSRPLLKRLEELQRQTDLTAGEQYEMQKIVEILNGLYPDLNLSIDEQTGSLNENITAIRAQVNALKNAAIQQALQEKFNGILDLMADAQVEVYENQMKLADATKHLTEAEQNVARAKDAVAEAQKRVDEAQDPVSLARYTEALNNAELALAAAEDEAQGWQSEVNKLNEAIKEGQGTVEEYAQEYENAVSGISGILSSEGQSAGAAFGAGLKAGLESMTSAVGCAAAALGRAVNSNTRNIMEIHSPSKVAEEIGKFWDMGLAQGMEKHAPAVEDASVAVAQNVITPPAMTTNNSTTHNVGGISVVVNGAPGQDVTQLADAVMEEIQAAVEREGAAL